MIEYQEGVNVMCKADIWDWQMEAGIGCCLTRQTIYPIFYSDADRMQVTTNNKQFPDVNTRPTNWCNKSENLFRFKQIVVQSQM